MGEGGRREIEEEKEKRPAEKKKRGTVKERGGGWSMTMPGSRVRGKGREREGKESEKRKGDPPGLKIYNRKRKSEKARKGERGRCFDRARGSRRGTSTGIETGNRGKEC